MGLPINPNPPRTMWIDMNSSFARTEQQAHPRLRGVPVGVGKYTNPNGPVISPSVEAKRYGIKTAHTVRNSRLLCPQIRILKSDPPKYREMHRRMISVFNRWSPDVLGKSIDEACISLEGSPALKRFTMREIAHEIKREIREACGEWITVSIGIGTNQFLAKTAAGLIKPDGLETIDHTNLRDVYAELELTDLCGINSRYQARLNTHGIRTPLEFLDADPTFLHREVFGSVVGRYWAMMLRGYEHQRYEGPERRSYGNSHSIREQTREKGPNLAILCKLCDMAGRRMRRDGFSCRRIDLIAVYPDGTYFKKGKLVERALYSTPELFRHATLLFNRQEAALAVHKLGVSLSHLVPGEVSQLDLFESSDAKLRRGMRAVDLLNDRYGEQVVYVAPMHGANRRIDDSVSFGSFGDVRQLYEEESAFTEVDDEELEWSTLEEPTGGE